MEKHINNLRYKVMSLLEEIDHAVESDTFYWKVQNLFDEIDYQLSTLSDDDLYDHYKKYNNSSDDE